MDAALWNSGGDQLDKALAGLKEQGFQYAVYPYVDPKLRGGADVMKRLAQTLKRHGRLLRELPLLLISVAVPAFMLIGSLWVAQVPHNSFTFQARYDNPRWVTVSVAGRAIGKQYDDDQNVFPLGSFFVLDAQVSRTVGAGFQIYGAVENLFNEKYATAATPVEQLGLPIVGRIGFRWQLPRK